MQLGSYRVLAPLDAGPAGAIFRAESEDSASEWEVRLLDRARNDPPAWKGLLRQLRLISLLDHPVCLKPTTIALDDDPPYLAVPPRSRLPARVTLARAMAWGERLADLLAWAHRLGLIQGALGAEHLRLDSAGRLSLDMTGTLSLGVNLTTAQLTPAGDIDRLGAFLAGLPIEPDAAETRVELWEALLKQMQQARPEERPLAREVAERIRGAGVTRTQDLAGGGHDLGATIDSDPVAAGSADGEPPLGKCLGRFRLLEKLGEGSVGTVYRAEDLADGAMVAVKVLHADRALSWESRRRFLKEARMLGKLETPFVTRLVEANTDGDWFFLALEYVGGPSLGTVLRERGKLDEPLALDLIADAARALAAAHALGIVHRDVKPDNILVVEEGNRPATEDGPAPRVKLTDFGLARPVDQSASLEVTQTGAMIGTPIYMAPEQFDSRPVDARTDVYALGVTLFHLLAGRPPFQADSFQTIMLKHVREAPPALERLEANVSLATAALVARALSKDPAARPADAGAFLRLIERIRRGEPVSHQIHPRLPAGPGPLLDYVYTWELRASPHQLWPHVANTERLNRAAGLPAVRYSFRADPELGNRRYAESRVAGLKMTWEEHPFEWVEGQRFGVLREFSRGPLLWFISIVDMQPGPAGGTILRQTLRAEPRGWLGKLAGRFELGVLAKRSLTRVYRSIDDALSAAGSSKPVEDPFEAPSKLTGARRRRLQAAQERLLAQGAAPAAVDLLGVYLSNAPAQELARIRPIALARRFGCDEQAMVDACLRSVGVGLLTLKWDVICPLCRIPSDQKDTLRELRDHENCPACQVDFAADFASVVELVLQSHPDIRQAELGRYCAGGPAHSPHVVAQTRVAAGERVELELNLTEGPYRLRGPRLPWSAELRVVATGAPRQVDVDLGAADRPAALVLAAGGQVLTLTNGRPHEVVVRIERTAARDDALTAAQATALPAFRKLFPGELLAPGQLARAATVSVLLTQIEGGDALYAALGEAEAFQVLQASFRIVEEQIRREGGTLVKTVGEGMNAVFPEVTAAVRAALGLGQALAGSPTTAALRLRVVVHRGLTMVATINDRLDYFGTTINQARHLLEQADGNELILTAALAADPEVNEVLRGQAIEVAQVDKLEKTRQLAFRVTLPSVAKDGQ